MGRLYLHAIPKACIYESIAYKVYFKHSISR